MIPMSLMKKQQFLLQFLLEPHQAWILPVKIRERLFLGMPWDTSLKGLAGTADEEKQK